MKKFRLPPISPLAGTSIKNYLRNLQNGHVEKQYWLKVFLTGLLILISEPFQQWEKVTFHRRLKRQPSILSPVFIVGHWRSGTTFLHNLLCQSTSAAYINTYQSVFPENLSSKWLFKTFMKWNMPDNRPGDHLRLHTNLPQEDEFAMSNIIPFAYYRFFYFPRQYNRFYDESVRMKMPTKNIKTWRKVYIRLIQKAIINTKGVIPIIKNPVNTGRIKMIKALFPNAKFIHIYRNPIYVYLSTKKFFSLIMPALRFQKVSQTEINQMIIDVYKKLYHDYFEQIEQIPGDDLVEIKYESFIKDPFYYIQYIYHQFGWKDYDLQAANIKAYLQSIEPHKKSTYSINQKELDAVSKEFSFTIDRWQYDISPQHSDMPAGKVASRIMRGLLL